MKKQTPQSEEQDKKDKRVTPKANTKVEHDTGKRPEGDTNPLPPNPNKVDNHDD